MTKLMKLGMLLGVQISALALLAALAFAAPEQNIGNLKQQLGNSNPAAVQVSGRLICDMGTENNGQPCSLRIEEDGTGHIYRLRGGDSVMRLYFDGARRATIGGLRDRDPATILVKSVSRL